MTASRWFHRVSGWRPARRHLSDDQLLALALAANEAPLTDQTGARHLDCCPPCQRHYRQVTADLDALSAAASADFDDIFTPSRLQTQRGRITHRLGMLVGTEQPARLLAFPFAGRSRPRFDLHSWRWVSAAVVVGVLLGVVAGQLVQRPPLVAGRTASGQPDPSRQTGRRPGDAATSMASGTPRADITTTARLLDMTGTVELPPLPSDQVDLGPLTLAAFDGLMADDEFLGNLDLALASAQVSELASIDALTPRVRDLSSNIR